MTETSVSLVSSGRDTSLPYRSLVRTVRCGLLESSPVRRRTPCRTPRPLLGLVFFAFGFMALPTRLLASGSYVKTSQTGGVCAYPGDPGGSYAYSDTTFSQSSGYGGFSSTDGPGVATCSGEITTEFTWTPDSSTPNDPAPTQVVVVEDCTAYGYGGADDGLGDPYDFLSCFSEGTRYQVKPGGPVVTVTCAPSCSTSGLGAEEGCFLTYSASVTPLFILRNGKHLTEVVNGIQNDHVLPGEINVLSIEGLPSSTTQPTEYSWNAAGHIFSDWRRESTEQTDIFTGSDGMNYEIPRYDTATVIPVLPYAFHNSSFYYTYATDAGAGSISCSATVHLAQGNLAVNLEGNLQVKEPTVTNYANWGQNGDGDVRLYPVAPAVPTKMGLVPLNTAGSDGGILFACSATIPEGWKQGGLVCYAQLLNSSRRWTDTSGDSYHVARNGSTGLDTAFPNLVREGPVPFLLEGPDSPSFDSLSPYTHIAASGPETFVTYFMFQPAGGQYVPLSSIGWGWTGDAQINPVSGLWALTQPGKYKGSWIPREDHPEWTFANHGDPIPGW